MTVEALTPQPELQTAFSQLKQRLSQQIIGQNHLVERLLIALLADGHLLVEGAPGLAKTRAIKSLSDQLEADYHRIQFTPDLLPADITGTDIFNRQSNSFNFQPGPIFHNLVLADEINRAPAKVQSALLEAMAERQVSIGSTTYSLPDLFLVMATQNPIEQEGTFPLPEAQLDRFLMQVLIDYPQIEDERQILLLVRNESLQSNENPAPLLNQSTLFAARKEVQKLYAAEIVDEYMVQLVMATRRPEEYDESLSDWIEYGASPRGTIALDSCARAYAWLQCRDYVTPADVQAIVHDVLRHRILLSFEAQAQGITTDQVIDKLLDVVIAP